MNLYVFSSAVNLKTLQIPTLQGQWQQDANAVGGSGLRLGFSVTLLKYTQKDTIFKEKQIPVSLCQHFSCIYIVAVLGNRF